MMKKLEKRKRKVEDMLSETKIMENNVKKDLKTIMTKPRKLFYDKYDSLKFEIGKRIFLQHDKTKD